MAAGGLLLAQGVATRNAPAEKRTAFSGKPWPVTFTDVSAAAGLKSPIIAGGERSKRYIIEANGSGVAFVDYDRDGWLDIFLVNGSRFDQAPLDATNRLYRNNRDGKFTDVTTAAGVGQRGWGNGVCAGDYDNDGFTDLYVTYWGPNLLYRNTGQGGFREVAKAAGVAGPSQEWSSGCTFVDYDRDGHLDLFVTSYQQFDLAKAPLPGKGQNCEWKGMPVFCGPRGLPFGRVTLYRNLGNGQFEDATAKSKVGLAQGFYAFTAIAADLTGDGWPDLYVASDSTPSLLFRNERNGTFTEIGTEAGVAFNEHGFEQGGMGIAVGDYNGDGLLDLLKTNFAGDHPNLYRGAGQGIFEDSVIQAGLGVNPFYVAWGVGFADLDNDGWPDVFQVNGHVYPELTKEYRNPRIVYRNLGNGRFEDVSDRSGASLADLHSSRGAAFGDIDNDGDLDVLIMNMNEAPTLLRNDQKSGNHWLRLRLVGRASNRAAIGALVTVTVAGGRRLVQPLLSQSSFVSQNDLRLHFGLGTATKVDAIEVRWPNGAVQKFAGPAADQDVELIEAP